MNDLFTTYETGMHQMLTYLGPDHPRYGEALTYQHRLKENIARTRQYGTTEARQSERTEIIDQINALARATGGTLLVIDTPTTLALLATLPTASLIRHRYCPTAPVCPSVVTACLWGVKRT